MHAGFSILILLVLLGVGVPVAWSFAGTLAFLVYLYDVNLNTLMLQGFRSLNSVVLLALPLFIMAGYLMQSGGVARRLIELVEHMVKGKRGGMGASMVLACGVFGAISGTATAAVASIGTIMTDPMEQRGYPRPYTAALLGISSLLGILIPPSITMILFAVVTQQSVAACFAATIGPGILLIIGLVIFNYVSAKSWFQEKKPVEDDSVPQRSFAKIFLFTLPALTMPIVILGGIYGGIFTPTEAAAVTVMLAVVIGLFVYKDLTLSKLRSSLVSAAETTGIVVLILLFSFLIGRILVAQGVPQDLTAAVTNLVDSPLAILLMVNAFLILVGMVIDDISLTVVIAPLLLPLVGVADVNPIHFAAIVACAVVVGSNSPPMAPVLYMSCRIARVEVHRSFVPAIAMIVLVAIPVQLITTFVPAVSLYIPRLFGLI
ncbi:MAG: TRAP transporter large permease [Burkholderiaceae bacterium]|nr:TRAP transporter large permease [Burkholderiaceae bacterium]